MIRAWSRAPVRRVHTRAVKIGAEVVELRTGDVARFADGAVTATCARTSVLATCVGTKGSESGVDIVPLTVDFRPSAAALGKIPTTKWRRELIGDTEVLAARAIDRAIRPLFHKLWRRETQVEVTFLPQRAQVVCKPMQVDEHGDVVVLGLNAAATALRLSRIPFYTTVAAVRVAQLLLNPSRKALKEAELDLLVAACNSERLMMVEMDGRQISLKVLSFKMITAIDELVKEAGRKKLEIGTPENDDNLCTEIESLASDRLHYVFTDPSLDKVARDEKIEEIRSDVAADLAKNYDAATINGAFSKFTKKTLRELTLETRTRCDGRKPNEFRPISAQVDVFPNLHGSALFQRGQTQVLGTVAFDSPSAAFHSDAVAQLLGAQRRKMFMLHYEFPQFATNDVGRAGAQANRREVGHGSLAEKALKHVIPQDMAYSIRLSCQVLESNGSSSMASACVGSLALGDAGVKLDAPVAGVAMGLFTTDGWSGDEEGKHVVLTDILGIEDYVGDMDFKIAGTRNGFTAMQLDLKLAGGLPRKVLNEALEASRKGIGHVLDKMAEVQPAPRAEFKSTVPIIEHTKLASYQRNSLFKAAGYNAKLIESETGVQVHAEAEGVTLTAPNADALREAKALMEKLVIAADDFKCDVGKILRVEIVEIVEKGVFVASKDVPRQFIPNSQLDSRKVLHASALGFKVFPFETLIDNVQLGDVIMVSYLGRDPDTGAHRFSRRALSL